MNLIVHNDGHVHCLYDETIDLSALGPVNISRGSYVEPDQEGRWHADLSPVAGPTLGPFVTRSQALIAERTWLDENWLNDDGAEQVSAVGDTHH